MKKPTAVRSAKTTTTLTSSKPASSWGERLAKIGQQDPGKPINDPVRTWVLDVPFEWRAWASQQGIRWDPDIKSFVFKAENLPTTIQHFQALPYSYEWHKQKSLNKGWSPAIPSALPRWEPRSHQVVAADLIEKNYLSGRVGFLLADDVGVGKTMSAVAFLLRRKELKKVLVVTTSNAQAHWRETFLHAGDGGKEIIIINYDRLAKLFHVDSLTSDRSKGKRKRIANQGKPEVFDAIIFDEAHKGRIVTSARSIMMEKLGKVARFVVWASATAGQNPLELPYLARLIAQLSGAKLKDLQDNFEEWWKSAGVNVRRGNFGKWEWEGDRASLARVRELLFGGPLPGGIRRLPTEIAGWKELQRNLVPVDLSPEMRREYEMEWHIFAKEVLKRKAIGKKQQGHFLAAQMRFRQKSSFLRIDSTLDTVADFLENGVHVAISVQFKETLHAMAEKLRSVGIEPALIHGDLSKVEAEKERLRFQKDQTPIVIFTVEEAISLHEGQYPEGIHPRRLVTHDLRWSAISMTQVDGRCHRDGKFAPSVWLYGANTVEAHIAQVLLDRIITMKSMHGDDTETLEAIEKTLFAESEKVKES